ncbi:MAG: amidohydrolase family protein [Geobacteraceae bacterium]|nr:amidohydrolase family protein [Geobacteraceae bacterium]
MTPKIYAASHILPVCSPPVEGGAIAVENGRIRAVGRVDELAHAFGAPVAHFPGCAIIPGLVNAHSHLELTHFPSWKLRKGIDYSPRTYVDWIIQVIKVRRALSLHERELSVAEGIRISLESGTTTVGEIVSDPSLISCYNSSLLAGRLFLEAIGQNEVHCEQVLASIAGCLDEDRNGRFRMGLSPHTPHTLSARFFSRLREFARARSLPLSVHLAESRAEVDFLFDSTGPIAEKLYPFVGWQEHVPPPRRTTPAAYLDSLGILSPGTVAVHCVHVTPADVEILRKSGVTVVLCPRSNDKLDHGAPPVHLLKKAGVPLALGTDSLASNDSLSMLDEVRFLLERLPDEFTAAEALRMITLSGGQALGIGEEVGSLEPGKRADFLVMEPFSNTSSGDINRHILEKGKLREVFIEGNPLG